MEDERPRAELRIGHGLQLVLQFIGVIIVIVGPMMWWAMTQQAAIATLTARVDGLTVSLLAEHGTQQSFQSELRTAMGTLSGSVGVLQGMLQGREVKEPRR